MILYKCQLINTFMEELYEKNSLDIKTGEMICKLSEVLAPTVSSYCLVRFYQPKQPEGLKEFVNSIKTKRMEH